MDWRAFVDVLNEKGFSGAFPIENEAANSKGTDDLGAITQGFKATVLNLAPMLWPLVEGKGYQYDAGLDAPLKDGPRNDIPVATMASLGV